MQQVEVSRERAADLLWGDLDLNDANPRPNDSQVLSQLADARSADSKPKHNLRHALYNINRVLPGGVQAYGRHSIALNQTVLQNSDVWQFDHRLRHGDPAGAVALYRGPLLDGLELRNADAFEEWLSERRAHYEHRVLTCLTALLADAHRQADSVALETYARQMLAINPLKERATRALMLALGRRGQFNAALEVYRQSAATLQRELGVAPSAETAAVYERVLLARAAPRRVLPCGTTTFVGREHEMAEASAYLARSDCRLLTLLGPGGVGKTRLAIELARRAGGSFLHGAAFAPLESFRPGSTEDDLLTALAHSLGLALSGGSIRAQLIEYLRPREMLLVLDNFELFVPVARCLTAVLREAHDVKLLVTSRQRLDLPDEAIYRVGGMSYARQGEMTTVAAPADYDAPALFAQVAARVNPGVDLSAAAHDVARICRLVEGLPLAIEMVAPWTLDLSPAAIADLIAADMSGLIEYTRNFSDRHRTLHIVFEHSWATLSPAEQLALRRLAVIVGMISPDAAETIAGATGVLLRGLARKSMVEMRDGEHYALHPLLRAFALEKLAAAGETGDARAAHYAYFQQYVAIRLPRLSGASQLPTLQQLTDAFDNTCAAWRFGSEAADSDTLLPLLDGLARLINTRTWYAIGIEALAAAAEPLARRGLNDVYGRLTLHQGTFHYAQGNYDAARRLAGAELPLAEARGDVQAAALGLRLMGSIAYDDNHYDEAEAFWNRSLALYAQLADWEAVADCLISLGNAAILKHTYSPQGKKPYRPSRPFVNEHIQPTAPHRAGAEAAIAYFTEALRLYTAIDNPVGVAYYWREVGLPYYILHDYETAAAAFREGIARYTQLDALDNLGQCHTWLAQVLTQWGKLDEARVHYHEALRIGLAAQVDKRLLDCLQKYSLFMWVADRQHATPLAINAFVAQHPNTGARMRVTAEEWLANITYFMRRDEGQAPVDAAIAYGRQQILAGLVHHLLQSQA